MPYGALPKVEWVDAAFPGRQLSCISSERYRTISQELLRTYNT